MHVPAFLCSFVFRLGYSFDLCNVTVANGNCCHSSLLNPLLKFSH
uniref:Uncharacterized protein n=1 Tax=Setaria viridis TaxID=4556 RepID=A0A4V6D1T9_SETVI|nr:hypothetical protein SEVIR_9G402633v2 [Setaria viridis]